jgi:integrase
MKIIAKRNKFFRHTKWGFSVVASFRKRGNTWTFQLETRDDKGNRKQITKGGFRTKKEAQLKAAQIQQEIENGNYYEQKDINIGEFFAEWLNHYARLNLNERTYANRKYMINARILPAIGKVKLKDLKPLMIQKLYKQCFDSGLSSNYVNTIHRLMLNALKWGVKMQLIRVNPVEDVNAPKIEKKTVKTWSIDQVKTFLNTSQTYWYHIGFCIAIYTGLRRGEILRLTWGDVDFDKKQLTVLTGKTKSATRTIAIPDLLISELKKHKAKQNQNKLLLMGAYADNDLIVCSQIGTPTNERNLNRSFYELLDKINVPKIRFHDLRHTHATILLQMGEHPKIVSERLGHSRVNITMDTYSHVMPEMQQETAKRLNDLMSK